MPPPPSTPAAQPLDDAEIDALQALLAAVPAPFDALDASSLDGFLCGVIVQPRPVPVARWWPFVTDVDGRALPGGVDVEPLRALVLRRHAELARAIAARQWFDPWVFAEAVEGDATVDEGEGPDDDAEPDVDAVYPWVAGIATAFELFPGVMTLPPEATLEPLALLYRHLDPDDLEDADALVEEIESMEPPADLAEAVEGLVRATLLLADAASPAPPRGAPRARSTTGRRRPPSG